MMVRQAYHGHMLGPGSSSDSRGVSYVPPPPGEVVEVRHIELSDDLDPTPGGTADAYPRNWNGTAYVTDLTATPFEVVDVLGIYRGRGRNSFSQTWDGSKGRAVLRNGQWEIEELQPHATEITCLIDMAAGLVTTDVNITVDTATIMSPVGAIWAFGLVTSVLNKHDFAGDDDGVVTAKWNEDTDQYEAVQVNCPIA